MAKQSGWGLMGGLALVAAGIAAAPAARGVAAAEPRPVLFASGRDGADQIQVYRMDENGGNQKALTTGPGFSFDPVLSPDGKQVVFAYLTRKEEKTSRICVMNLDGTGRKELTGGGSLAVSPSWSPDGKRILYTAMAAPEAGQPPVMKLHLMDADGKNDAEMGDGLSSDWSKDGKELLYTAFKQGEDISLHAVGADGANPRQLAPSKSGLGIFSPDGKKIAYLAGEAAPDVFVADADGKNPVQLTKTEDMEMGVAWSGDGKKVFFSRFPREEGEATFTRSEIFSTDLEGKTTEQLTTNEGLDAFAGGFLIFGLIRG